MNISKRTALAVLAGAIASAAVLGTSVAIASIPSTTNGSISSCVSKTTGTVRIIDYQAGKRCHSTERGVSWFSGPTVHTFAVPFTALATDRSLHRIASLRLPRAGTWTLVANSLVHINVRFAASGAADAQEPVYGNCEIRNVFGHGVDYADATTYTDQNGNGWLALSMNATVSATATARTASLWCRADSNAVFSGTAAGADVRAHLIATRVAGVS